MSAPHRCRECLHRPGPRSTAPMTVDGQPKKAPCSCNCHSAAEGAAQAAGRSDT